MNNEPPFIILSTSWSFWSFAVYAGQIICLCLIVWCVMNRLRCGKDKPFSRFLVPVILLGFTSLLFGVIDFLRVLIFGIRPVLCTQVDPVGQDIGLAIMGALFPVYAGALLLVAVFITVLILCVVQRPK